ncbi:Chromobox protein-like protein 3 [Acropora cervicornis]|uniref:Chromobox protein-like protein 3 n=1 Tax=Acropora cervicornis TaxID=6130 RepID=A0AAD9V2X5_ACRCE|nr:Chromobox protein-like protein 3 [Acropora cervicornis]
MSKRSRHHSGFYASLLSNDLDQAHSSKYRPRVRPAVMGIYEVERVVAKRFVGGKAEYFIPWKNYCPSENTWEPAEHLPEELITAFECRVVDRVRADECKERLALLFEKGLKSHLACKESITIRHVVL